MCSKRVKIDDDNDGSGSSGAEENNCHLCRAKLPPETWSEIWSLLARLEDRITVSHVCREWRTMALGDHLLWGHIAVWLDQPITSRASTSEDRLEIVMEEHRTAARWLRLAKRALERAGRTISLDIRIDYCPTTNEWITGFCVLINKYAPRIVRLSLKLGDVYNLRACLKGFTSPMPNVRVLGLNVLHSEPWGISARDIPFALFPNVEVFKSRPCDFEDVTLPLPGLSKAIRSVRSNAASSASLCALLHAFPEPKHFAIRIVYADKCDDPEEYGDLDYLRSRFAKLDRLELTWGWKCYAITRKSIPRTAPRPSYISIGLHCRLDRAYEPENETCMAVEDTFSDVVPAPITLTLEQCDPPWKYLPEWGKKPFRITVHDPASGQTRQLALHWIMLYERPKVMQLLCDQLSGSPISSLTVPWDLMEPLMAQLKEDNLRTITELTLIVTRRLTAREFHFWDSLLWPVLPGLQHVTLKEAYPPADESDRNTYRVSVDILRGVLEKLVPPPWKLHTLSLHHVRTGGCVHWDWNSVQSLATNVYGLHILSEEKAESLDLDCEHCKRQALLPSQ